MLTVNKIIAGSRGLAAVLLRRAATVELAWDVRQKSRFDCADTAGRALGVFLPRGTAVRGGDALVVEDGTLVIVKAAAQPVLVVRHDPEHGTPLDLLRAAYHLGNRHVPLELQAEHLKLEPDHVLAEMLRSMHLRVDEALSAFEPEAGAYGEPGTRHAHGHGHGHEHGHDQAQGPGAPARRAPIAIAEAPAPHVHGPGCGHDHGPHEH